MGAAMNKLRSRLRPLLAIAALSPLAAFTLIGALAQSNPAAVAQQDTAGAPTHSLAGSPEAQQQAVSGYAGTKALLDTPVTGIFPGGISTRPDIKKPVANDPAGPQRGMAYFAAFNCEGCHAANGGGGMGRALSNRFFEYGESPANIYLTIVQGRPNGMPAWGGVLPDSVIWDLVAYIEQISNAPQPQWGTTIAPGSPDVEQAPAEFNPTPNPWAFTEPFSNGQNPSGGHGAK